MLTICIDAGHYKKTAGRRCLKTLDPQETREWELNRRVADVLQALLQGYNCMSVRADDPTGETLKSLAERVSAAEKAHADCYISIHHNAGVNGGLGGGTVVYTAPGCYERTKNFQKAAYEAVVKRTGLKGNRSTPLGQASYYVLAKTSMTAILIECGFMDSAADVPVILKDDFAGNVAAGLLEALVSVFKLERKAVREHMRYTNQNGINIVEVPARDFGISLVDAPKRSIDGKNYANAGFFGNYNEGREKFTLPAGHLVCDFEAASKWVRHYCTERGSFDGSGRFSYSEGPNKSLTTIYVKDGKAGMETVTRPDKSWSYALAGVPVMRNGNLVPWPTAKSQGWEASSLYATRHIFAGIKADRSKIYVMECKTTSGNLISSREAYNKFKPLGFTDVLKVDGGGSTILKVGGKVKASTVGNRRICTVFTFGGNPYSQADKTLKRGSRGEAVKWLQWELNDRGFQCDIDGSFGPATETALRAYQTSAGLAPDGSCGPATRQSLLA